MGLHDRLHRQNGSTNGHGPEALDALGSQTPEPTERPPDPYGDLKGRIHHACSRSSARSSTQPAIGGGPTDDLAEQVLRVVTELLALDHTPMFAGSAPGRPRDR